MHHNVAIRHVNLPLKEEHNRAPHHTLQLSTWPCSCSVMALLRIHSFILLLLPKATRVDQAKPGATRNDSVMAL